MRRLLPLSLLLLVGCGQQRPSNDQLYGEFFANEKQVAPELAELRRKYSSDPQTHAERRRHTRFLTCMSSNRAKQTSFTAAVTACRIESEAGA